LKRIVADKKFHIEALKELGRGELVSPTRRRRAVEHLQRVFGVSQRWASQLVGQPRSTQRHQPVEPGWDRPCEPSCGSSAGVTANRGAVIGLPVNRCLSSTTDSSCYGHVATQPARTNGDCTHV